MHAFLHSFAQLRKLPDIDYCFESPKHSFVHRRKWRVGMGASCTGYSAQVQMCKHEMREQQLYCMGVCVRNAEVEALLQPKS